MNYLIDFLSFKTILRYLILFSIIILAGHFGKDAVVVLLVVMMLFCVINRDLFKSFEIWIIWASIYSFFIGQQYINNIYISQYVAKPYFLIFIIFFAFYNRIPIALKKTKFFYIWILFLITLLFGSLYHLQAPFSIMTQGSMLIGYLVFRAKGLSKNNYRKLLNLFVAISLLQLIISVLQLIGFIEPTRYWQNDGIGGKFLWEAGLDDLARGTFFVDTSLYVCFVAVLLLFIGVKCKKKRYFILAIISLIPISLSDNKLYLGIMIAMILWFMLYIVKEKRKLRINFKTFLYLTFIVCITGLSSIILMDVYYKYQSIRGGVERRTSVRTVYELHVAPTVIYGLDNIKYWGKIRGFNYVFQDLADKGIVDIIVGYGMNNENMFFIERNEMPFMKVSNFLNSRSGLIYTFGQTGLFGFVLLAIYVLLWYKYNLKIKLKNLFEDVCRGMLHIVVPFLFLTAFLRLLFFYSIPVVMFFILIAILKEISECQDPLLFPTCNGV